MKKIQPVSEKVFWACLGLCCMAVVISCSKNSTNLPGSPVEPGYSYISVTNLSPSANMYGVYSDNAVLAAPGSLGYGTSTGIANGSPYESISDSMHSIYLYNNGMRTNIDSAYAFQDSGHYSLFLYDTSQLKVLAVQDNFSVPPPAGDADVRFLNFSSNTASPTLELLGTDSAGADTTSYPNFNFVGLTIENSDSLGNFQAIAAGTYHVLLMPGLTMPTDSVTFAAGHFYTVYFDGYVNGYNGADSLSMGVLENR